MRKTNQRGKRLWLNNKYQSAVLRLVILQWLGFCGTAMLVLCVMEVLVTGQPPESLGGALADALRQHLLLLLVLVALLPKLIYDTLRLSHRVAGPLLRLDRAMQAVADGGPAEPVRIRQDDYFQSLVDQYNRLLENRVATPPAKPESSKLEQPVAVAVH